MVTSQSVEQASEIFSEDERSVTAEKIVAAVEEIVVRAKPLTVRAFGSRARGDHRPDSDLDLAVIVDEGKAGFSQHMFIRQGLDPGFAMDMLLMTRSRYEFMKDSIVSVQRDIFEEGVTLYDASNGTVNRGAAARLAA